MRAILQNVDPSERGDNERNPQLSYAEYQLLLRHDLMSFIERSFYELNPQTSLFKSPHIEVMASRLEACRQGKIRRLIVNQPPRSLKSHAVSVAFVACCSVTIRPSRLFVPATARIWQINMPGIVGRL